MIEEVGALFDDPKRKLQELEDQLLAAEETTLEQEDEFQKIYAEVLAEFGPGDTQEQEPPIRNFANGYGRNVQPVTPVAPPPMPEPEPILEEEEPTPTKRERIGGLVFLAVIECLIFAGLAALWLGGK